MGAMYDGEVQVDTDVVRLRDLPGGDAVVGDMWGLGLRGKDGGGLL